MSGPACPRCGAAVVEIGPEGGRCARGHLFTRDEVRAAHLGQHREREEDHEVGPRLTIVANVAPQHVRWLWRHRLPLGKLAIIDGDPGLGKSLLTLDLAARVTTGRPMPDGTPSDLAGPAGVVLLSAEDDVADTIRPRLEAAGADLTRVAVLVDVPRIVETSEGVTVRREPPTVADGGAIEAAIRQLGAALVVIDPLMAYLPGEVNAHRDQDVRRVLAPLAALAARTDTTILVIRHLNKTGGTNAIYRGGGSIGIIGAARAGLLVARDPDDQDRRVVAVTKMNLSAAAPSLAYRIEERNGAASIAWLGEVSHTAVSVLAAQFDDNSERSALDEAKQFLLDILAAGPVTAREVQRQARAAGIAERTLRRAREAIGLRAQRVGGLGSAGEWVWQLPESASFPARDPAVGASPPPEGTALSWPNSPYLDHLDHDGHHGQDRELMVKIARLDLVQPASAAHGDNDDAGGIRRTCIDCGGSLEPGQRYRCRACLAAG